MDDIEIRRLERHEVKDVATYANAEGLNISFGHLQSCYDIPSTDWWGAVKDGRVIGFEAALHREWQQLPLERIRNSMEAWGEGSTPSSGLVVLRPFMRGVSTSSIRVNAEGKTPVSAFHKGSQALRNDFGIKMTGIKIRRLQRNEMEDVVTYANAEGWDKSLEYLQSCYDVPSIDCWGAVKDGRVIGSVARHDFENQPTSFGGLYLIDKPYRHQGIGLKLFMSVLSPVRTNNFIFLAVDPTMYANTSYKSSYRIHAAKGRKGKVMIPSRSNGDFRVVPLVDVPLLRVEEYDAKIHPLKRTAFFHNVIVGNAVSVFVALDQLGEVIGYGVLRRAAKGWRFNPIYAETDDVGHELFRTLLNQVPEGDEIAVDMYADNPTAIMMAEDHNFSRMFTSTLMYTETLCEIPVMKIYSIASQDFSPF